MFFDIGWPEFLLIGVVALVVIGPKDLPRALRIAGFWVRKARTLSREFQSSIDQMIREAELDEVREELKKATELDIEKEIRNTVDPSGELAESIKPPGLPDYFEEPPRVSAPAPALAAPADTAGPESASPGEGTLEATEASESPPAPSAPAPVAAEHPVGTPAPVAAEHPVGTPAPDHEPAPPKP
jgi:sec-independent protein translocase protein TatB